LFAINFCNCFLIANDEIVTNDIFLWIMKRERKKEKRKKKDDKEEK
jgi:hypothetical protein